MTKQIRRAVVIAFFAGALFGTLAAVVLHVNEVQAAPASRSFVVTGELSIPGKATRVTRLEDKEYNVVCYGYVGSGFISCTKK